MELNFCLAGLKGTWQIARESSRLRRRGEREKMNILVVVRQPPSRLFSRLRNQ